MSDYAKLADFILNGNKGNKMAKDKKSKKEKKSKKDKKQTMSSIDNPIDFKHLSGADLMFEMESQVKEKKGDYYFDTKQGIVRVRNTGNRINWQLKGKQIPRPSLVSVVSGVESSAKEGKKKDKKEKVIETDEKDYLITKKQLKSKLLVSSLVDVLELKQYGKKKQRKIIKAIEEEAMKGKDIVNKLIEVYDGVPVHDLFTIFEGLVKAPKK